MLHNTLQKGNSPDVGQDYARLSDLLHRDYTTEKEGKQCQ